MNKAPFLSSLIQKFAFQRDYISLWVYLLKRSEIQCFAIYGRMSIWCSVVVFVSEVPVLSSLEDGTQEIKETNKGTFSLKE